ncbi:hypothetical protein [Microcoleus sp. F4-D5]
MDVQQIYPKTESVGNFTVLDISKNNQALCIARL